MDKIKSFKELNIWKKAIKLCVEIYSFTKTMPDDEKFGLISQMRRASTSVAANIAEGCQKPHKRVYPISLHCVGLSF